LCKAVRLFRLSAEQGDEQSQTCLGCCYMVGDGVTADLGEGVRWFRLAAEQGCPDAQTYLGYCYAKGRGVIADLGEAVRYYRLSAEQGNIFAQYHLGECYRIGSGVRRDEWEAVRWYRRSADQGNSKADCILTRGDLQEALRVYALLAVQSTFCRLFTTRDNHMARCSIGHLYMNGNLFQRDLTESHRWFRLSAIQGNATAQLFLGYHYLVGIHVLKDFKKALRWIYLSAGNGSHQAQYILATYYLDLGPKTFQKATGLLFLAASGGYSVASAQLSTVVISGSIGNRDLSAAKYLRKLARKQFKKTSSESRAFEKNVLLDCLSRGSCCSNEGCQKAENPNPSEKRQVSRARI
jgi:TPR repeat protein